MKPLAQACLAAILLLPAQAAAQAREYWPEYAAIFRQACGQHEAETVCQCALDRLVARVGYAALAKEISVHEARFFRQSGFRPQAQSAVQYCRSSHDPQAPAADHED